jgi:hypothetical protein
MVQIETRKSRNCRVARLMAGTSLRSRTSSQSRKASTRATIPASSSSSNPIHAASGLFNQPVRAMISDEDRQVLSGSGASRRRGDRDGGGPDVMVLEVAMR